MRHLCWLLFIPLFFLSCKKDKPNPLTVQRNAQLKVTVKKLYSVFPMQQKDSALHNALVVLYPTADDRTANENAEHSANTDTAGVALFTTLKLTYYYVAVSYGGKTVYDEVSTPDNALSLDEVDF